MHFALRKVTLGCTYCSVVYNHRSWVNSDISCPRPWTGESAERRPELIQVNVAQCIELWNSAQFGGHPVDERRKAPRAAQLATGQILFGSAILHCAIVDLSNHGACLELSTTDGLPSEFVLRKGISVNVA